MSSSYNRNDETTALKKPTLFQRQSSTLRYNTFPTAPPRHTARKDAERPLNHNADAESRPTSSSATSHVAGFRRNRETPLPKGQLAMLAIIALAEQTALNSISPYLPEMASTFPDVNAAQVGISVGLIASAFAIAQFATNFLWGWLSDRIGRKPVILCGTLLTAGCLGAFGFCRTLWQAIIVQALMGLVNGNAGVVSTCLGEITDRSNQSKAFTYLPVIYGLGAVTGPIFGGLLVFPNNPFNPDQVNPYPYLGPNLCAAAVLVASFSLSTLFLEESLESAQELPPLGKRVGSIFAWIWQLTSSYRPESLERSKKTAHEPQAYRHLPRGAPPSDDEMSVGGDGDGVNGSMPDLFPCNGQEQITKADVFTRDTILLLTTFLISQLANISYNSLYPIFGQASPPAGRDLGPEEIGVSLAFAGVVTILFQIGIFGLIREKIGNKITYRAGFAGFVIAFVLTPWVGYKDGRDGPNNPTTTGRIWLWMELGSVLIIKTVASVGGLTSALLLITNSAPSPAVLGTLNGLAQTLSAAGRAVGPFLSGSLFTAAVKAKPKGEALAFGVFAGVSFLGFLMSFGIRGADLESDSPGGEDAEDDVSDDDIADSVEGRR